MRPGRAVSALRTPVNPPAPTTLVPLTPKPDLPELNAPQQRLLREAVESGSGHTDLTRGKSATAKVLERRGLGKYLCSGAGWKGSGARFRVNDRGREVAMAYAEMERA